MMSERPFPSLYHCLYQVIQISDLNLALGKPTSLSKLIYAVMILPNSAISCEKKRFNVRPGQVINIQVTHTTFSYPNTLQFFENLIKRKSFMLLLIY